MVEFLMIFALGALVAMLGGLMLLPALNARAQRLQRRKLEALFPMSIAEITAERDHVRAEMAVEARRTEMRAEATAREKAADLAEIGRRDVHIHRLNETLAARDTTIGGLEHVLSDTRTTLAETEQVRDRLTGELTVTRADLAGLQDRHQRLEIRFEKTDAELSATRQSLAMTQDTLAATEAELNRRNEAFAALSADHQALHSLASERQMNLVAVGTKMEILTAEKQEFLRQIAEANERIIRLESALRNAEDEAREARTHVAENSGKLDEARAALQRMESRQLAHQRAIDTARQKARDERNAAQAASLALVKAQAEIQHLSGKLQKPRLDEANEDEETNAPIPAIAEARVVRMNRERGKAAAKNKPPQEAAE